MRQTVSKTVKQSVGTKTLHRECMPLYYACFSLCKKCTFTVTYPFCNRLVIMRTYQYKLRKMYHMNMAQRKSFLLLKRRCIVFSNFSVETGNLRLYFKVLRIFSLEKNATNLLQILNTIYGVLYCTKRKSISVQKL